MRITRCLVEDRDLDCVLFQRPLTLLPQMLDVHWEVILAPVRGSKNLMTNASCGRITVPEWLFVPLFQVTCHLCVRFTMVFQIKVSVYGEASSLARTIVRKCNRDV